MRLRWLIAVWFAALLFASHARAQSEETLSPAEVRTRASRAYEEGNQAYRARDFATAAERFETAFRLVPSAEALVQAMRAHLRAGHELRAVTLAARAIEAFPEDENTDRYARPTMREYGAHFFRIEVHCEGCAIELDGTRQETTTLFVSPDEDHALVVSFPSWSARQTVRGGAGERRALEYEAPMRYSDVEEAQRDGWSPIVFWSCVGATAVMTGVTIWSGVDTLSHNADYEAMPTQAGLEDGRQRELRTNVLIGVTAGVAVGTALIGALATDWSPSNSVTAGVSPIEGGALATLGGSLP